MKKKIITLLLAVSMLSVLLSGCGEKSAELTETACEQTTVGQAEAATLAQIAGDAETTAEPAETSTDTTAAPETVQETEATREPVTCVAVEREIYPNCFDITDFGAVGDGVTDCTAAVQAAMDAAGLVEGTVLVPAGKYVVGQLKMSARTRLEGDPSGADSVSVGSVFLLRDADALYMIDITGAYGSTIAGMTLSGRGLGQGIHGIFLSWPRYNGGDEEDTPSVEDCRIGDFTGNGVHLNHIWCFRFRHNILHDNGGAGLYVNGWDGFILDNHFVRNGNCGIQCDIKGAALTVTGNRLEYNAVAGLYVSQGDSLNVTGNYFDCTGGPAILLGGRNTVVDFAITGNVFSRSGCTGPRPLEDQDYSCHIYLRSTTNGAIVGNTFKSGMSDDGQRLEGPDADIFVRNCRGIVIKSNTMYESGLKKIIDSKSTKDMIIKDNVTHHKQETENP